MNKEITKVQELTYELTVEEAMTKNVVAIQVESRLDELRSILKMHRISGIPVLNGDELVGIISIEDFIKCLQSGEGNALVLEKMTKGVETLFSDEPLIQAFNKFEKYGFGRFPVIDRKSNKLVGILTKSDIIKTLLKKIEIDYHEEEIHKYRASHIFEDIILMPFVHQFSQSWEKLSF